MSCHNLVKSLFLASLGVCLLAGPTSAEKWRWTDIRKTFEDVLVRLDDPAIVEVDLPENFIKNTEHVSLVLTLISGLVEIGVDKRTFLGLMPKLVVNKKLYTIPVRNYPGMQTVEIKIKAKHLRSSNNTLKIDCDLAPDWEILTPGTAIMLVKEMYFKDVP